MAASKSEDRLEVAAMFSVMISGSRFFPVDSDTDARISLFSEDSRGGSVGMGRRGQGGNYVSTQHTKQLTHKLLFYRLGTMFPHIIHLFSLLILFKSNYLVITCMSENVFPHLIFVYYITLNARFI